MKKILFLAIIGIITFSLIECGDTFKTINTMESNKTNVSSSNNKIEEAVSLDDETNIKIEVCAAEVYINSYTGEEVKIAGQLSENSDGFNISKDGNTIGIVEKGYEIFRNFINTGDNRTKINILIPSKFKGNFEFKQGVGTSEIQGINAKNISISGGAGELKCEDIVFDNLNLNSAVGEVDLNLNKKCGNINLTGGVGKIKVNLADVGGNLIYNGGVGETDITVPKNSPIKFITQKGVGKCNISAETSSKETYSFDLKVGAGSINVRN